MNRTVRSFALAATGALLLSACGALNALIPDQTIDGGVLGIGSAGVDVDLNAASASAAGIAVSQANATTWVGTISGTTTVDAIADLPDFVEAAAITETVALGDTVVVTHPAANTGDFTVTGVALGGTVTIGGTPIALPAGIGVTGLSVLFASPDCTTVGTDQVCTYTTASNVPVVDIEFAAAQVAAYSDLLKDVGGTVSADLTVTVTLAGPGLPDDATITVTLESLDAVVEF